MTHATAGRATRDPDLWFPDGNVVVLAENTAFRIHSGLLSHHSTVFSDLFGVPQPPQNEDLVDGCPIVHVSDSAEEFKCLLRMVYDGFNYLQPDVPIDFPVLAALARLGHKYQLDGVVAEAVRRLQPAYPSSFDIWEAGQDSVRFSNDREAFAAINLFRLLDRKDMLPIAIYRSTLPSHRDLLHSTLPSTTATERLSLDDVEIVLEAQYELLSADASMMASWFNTPPSEHCTQHSLCAKDIATTQRSLCNSLGGFLHGAPLDDFPFKKLIAEVQEDSAICEACVDFFFFF
ncbi:hypothetical protein OH76DRAFT_1363819 [Lentinus brumalis]|uniref:BTB domain-containing protein n=1 Tax=Lentinus brumalis TaxID=2498619 RepID=A0A371CNH1_9APHY|nr:hypothetical protein OH76DRAFT_1363819 [Polyporus brumalis]